MDSYIMTEHRFLSADGVHTIYAEIYTPKHRTARGIVQLCHGMLDYTARYIELAKYLTSEGYIFAGHHHIGHGHTVTKEEDFGYFGEKGGLEVLVGDMHTMNRYLRDTYPALPLVILGHSMGSFIARLYTLKHQHSAVGAIFHGTGGPNPLIPLGRLVATINGWINGSRHRSRFITSLAFGSYNKNFPKEEGEGAWLTRDVAMVSGRPTDRFTNFTFTISGYRELFRMIADSNSNRWFKNYPREMPTLIISGDMDPVGDYGRGPEYIYKRLVEGGHSAVSLKMYEGARHELFNESNRQEVFRDIVGWLGGIIR